MWSSSTSVRSIFIVWLVLGLGSFSDRDSQENPNCKTCVHAKPLTSKYKYLLRSKPDKDNQPVAILLSINTNGKPKKGSLNAIEISPEIFSDIEDSDESIEIPVKTRGGKLSARTSHALGKLLRPLIENGDIESASEEQSRNDWECKRDELINLLRVVLKRKEHALTNKHGVIEGVISDDEIQAVPLPTSVPTVPIVPVLPVIQQSDTSSLDDIAEILRPLPAVIREKVEPRVKDIIDKVSDSQLPDLKAALKNVIRDLVKNLIESAITKEEATDDVPSENPDGHLDEKPEASTEDDAKPEISDLKDILINISPKKIKEKLLQLIKRIIEVVAEKGVEALEELVTDLLTDLIKDLVTAVEDIPSKLEQLKPVLKDVGGKIIGGIKEILKISAGSELDNLKDNVKSILKKLIEELLELLVPDKESEPSTTDSSTAPSSISPKRLITDALLSVVDKIFDELSDDEPESSTENMDVPEQSYSHRFHTASEIFDRLKQIPDIIEQKLLEGVKRIIGQIGKDNGPTLEEMVDDIVEEIITGILSPDKPLPDVAHQMLQPVVKTISSILLNAIKEIMAQIASKDMEGIEDAIKSVVTNLLKDVIDFISGNYEKDSEAPPTSSLPDAIPDAVRPIVDKVLEKLLHKDTEPTIESPVDNGNCDKDYDGIDDEVPKPRKPGLIDVLKIGAKVLSGVKSVVEKIGVENLENLKDKLKEIVTQLCDEDDLKEIVKPILEKVNSKILECITNILGLAVKNDIENINDVLKELIQNLLGELLKLLSPNDCGKSNALNDLLEKFAPVIEEIVEKFTNAIKDKAKDVVEDLIDINDNAEDVNESASQIEEAKSDTTTIEETDPIPEGLVSDKLLPVIDEIVDVLDKGGLKNNKDFIKEITDELLTTLLTTVPEKKQLDEDISEQEKSGSISEEHESAHEGSEEEAHLDQSPEETVPTVLPVLKAVVEAPLENKDDKAPEKVVKEDVPEVIVTPTNVEDTFRVTLNIDKLVDKEFKKFLNLQCRCNEASLAGEPCHLHSVSKDDIKNSLRGQFFRKLIKAVPLAGEESVLEHPQPLDEKPSLSEDLDKNTNEDSSEENFEDSSDDVDDTEAVDVIKKLLEKAGSVVLAGKETFKELLGKEEGKQKLLDALKEILTKLLEPTSSEDETTGKLKKMIEDIKNLPDLLELLAEAGNKKVNSEKSDESGDVVKELLSKLISGLVDKKSSESDSRRKRQDFENYHAILGDDETNCPTCMKTLHKRSQNGSGSEKFPKVESAFLEHGDDEAALRVERAIGGGCLSCGSVMFNDFLDDSSTEIYDGDHRSGSTTGSESQIDSFNHSNINNDGDSEPLRVTLDDDIILDE